jgi:hypothetical protein
MAPFGAAARDRRGPTRNAVPHGLRFRRGHIAQHDREGGHVDLEILNAAIGVDHVQGAVHLGDRGGDVVHRRVAGFDRGLGLC